MLAPLAVRNMRSMRKSSSFSWPSTTEGTQTPERHNAAPKAAPETACRISVDMVEVMKGSSSPIS